MKIRQSLALIALVAGLFAAPHDALAQEAAGGTVALLVDVEKFKWTEFDAAGNSTWEDDGPRAAIGVAWSNLRVPTGGPVYRAFARLYGGIVDSDDLVPPPVSTETRYLGIQAEGVGGYRFGGRVGFELVSGIGFDLWHRNILDGEDAGGTAWSYDRENWAIVNAKLGAGFFTRFENFAFAVRGGPKLPLVAWQRVYVYDGVDLMPKPELSWFGQAEFNFGVRGKDNVTLAVYYDSYKFKASKSQRLTDGGVFVADVAQPDSEMQVAGVRLAIGF